MEISDINKVANRKRMNTDVEKLREKVSRETAKIIKLKVAQDTAYWDLKEKLQQVEGNHERLQQNMVEVQMQHESLSSRHQEELRRRPETLNKVVGTRSICSVLEEYGCRVKASVSRGAHDAAALGAAYAGGARRVRELAGRVRELAALTAAHRDHRDHLRALLDAHAHTLREKEEAAAELRAEGRRAALEHEARLLRAGDVIAERDNQISSLRAAASEAAERADTLRQRLQEAEARGSETARRVGELEDRERALTQALQDNRQALAGAQAATSSLSSRLAAADARAAQLQGDVDARAAAIEDLAAARRSLEDQIDTIRNDFETYRRNGEAKIAELEQSAASAGRELDAATSTITRLMGDVRDETDRRAKLDAALAAQRRHADALARDKDDELAKQMSIILECRGEKERLQERIAAMQATIDNIQKELTGRVPAEPQHPPERGPSPAKPLGKPPQPLGKPPQPLAAPPLPAPPLTAPLLYDFLSDSSVDGETLDASEVRRRFEALSRAPRPATRVAPPPRFSHATISLSQVKNDLKMKDRTFFKNKRFGENKAKKPK